MTKKKDPKPARPIPSHEEFLGELRRQMLDELDEHRTEDEDGDRYNRDTDLFTTMLDAYVRLTTKAPEPIDEDDD